MALQRTALARQCLSSDHVRTLTDTKATLVLQQRNGVFYPVRTEYSHDSELVIQWS
jgi:hypothetical protein